MTGQPTEARLRNDEVEKRRAAKFKIDLIFGKGFSTQKPSAGGVVFLESGRALHGEGDVKLYLCPGRHLKITDCEAFISSAAQGAEQAVCVKCGKIWKSEELIGEVFYKLSPPKWAEVLAGWFRKLDSQADVRIIYPPDDIRALAAIEQEKPRGGDLLDPARTRRATRVYPLENIMKDLSTGADLTTRMLAFVRA
jgi:hypothetical protein